MDEKFKEEISHIRQMMEKSTRFLSLSGWAGILAGTYALIGAYFAYRIVYTSKTIVYNDIYNGTITNEVLQLLGIALIVLVLAIASAIFTSSNAAKKSGEKLWSPVSIRMFANMFIPLISGGVLSIILLQKGTIGLIAPVTLMFYGLSLILASGYTYSNIKILGILELILGLLAAYFQGFGLYFWAIGFGVFHIIYGIFMYLKYKK